MDLDEDHSGGFELIRAFWASGAILLMPFL